MHIAIKIVKVYDSNHKPSDAAFGSFNEWPTANKL